MTYIVAEAGINANGDVTQAMILMHRAKQVGADSVKFQAYIPELLADENTPKAPYQGEGSQLEMLQKYAFGRKEFEQLKEYADKIDIGFFCSVFGRESMELVEGLQDIYKVPSGELVNWDLLDAIDEKKGTVLLSTGMAENSEITHALQHLQNSDVTLLHCVSLYPCPHRLANVSNINYLRSVYSPLNIGYSDHTLGIVAPIMAATFGATVIEKHLTLDRNAKGPDHAASIGPVGFEAMVEAIYQVDLLKGEGRNELSPEELAMRQYARRKKEGKR